MSYDKCLGLKGSKYRMVVTSGADTGKKSMRGTPQALTVLGAKHICADGM